MAQARDERKMLADRRLIEAAFPPQVSLPPLLPRKERAARAHLDAAHLAGAAAVGGEPGGVAGDAAAGSGPPGRAPQAAGADGGAGGGSVERQWGADEGEDPGRDLPLRARGRWEACEVPGGDPGGVRGVGAAGAGPVRGRQGDSAGSDAARVGGDGGGHQSRGVVHPALHAPLSAPAGRGGTAIAVVRAARSGLGRAVPRKNGGQSMLGRESVSVKRPRRFAGTQCGRDARAPRSARANPEGRAPNRPDAGGRSRPRGIRSAFTPTLTPAYQKLADNVHDSPREHRR